MSGIEIVGIILGSIPLLISALEHYGEGLSTIQRWRKYERELQSLIRNLQTERVRLQNVCEKLLVGLVPDSDIEVMIESPFGDLWHQEAIAKKIRARLWKSSAVFENTIKDIRTAIDEIKAEIGSQRDGNVSALRRGIFTLRRSHYEDRISTIRSGVSNLENLTDRNIDLEPKRRVRSQTKLFSVLRDMAGSFYRALWTSFRCSCKHQIGLELQRRSADLCAVDDNDKIMKDLSFQLAISYESTTRSDGANSHTVSDWQEIVVKACAPPPQALAPSQATEFTPAHRRSKTKKSVSFRFSQSTTSTSSTGTLTNLVQTTTELHNLILISTMNVASSVAFSSVGAVFDLCGKLRQSQKQAACDTYGILIDQVPQPARRYSVHPAPNAEDSRSWSMVSLRDILEQKTRFPHLSYKNRLWLAVTISSSVLQLHGTPWLPSILTSRHIFFIRRDNPLGRDMYLRPVWLRRLTDGEDRQPVNNQAGLIAEHNPTLLSLGCVLIEVILGRALNSRDAGVDLMSDYVVARSLMPEVRMASSNYERAVTNCVELHARGLENGDVYSGVVALLEKDLDEVLGRR